MSAIGCTALGQNPAIGAIGLPVTADSFVNFDCGTIPSDSIVNAIQGILSDRAAADGMTTAMVNGYWKLIDFEERCVGDGGQEPIENPNDSMESITITATRPCYTVLYYQWESGGGGAPDAPPPPPGGGGGGGGGGSGGGDGDESPSVPPPADSTDVIPLAVELMDSVAWGDTINCQLQQVNPAAADYCGSSRLSELSSVLRERLEAANERMRAKGGLCAIKARIVDSLLARDAIRVSSAIGYTGWSPNGLRGMGGILFNTMMLQKYYDESHAGRIGSQPVTLQVILSHEVDHLMGVNGHVDAQGVLTSNTIECSEYGPD